jgi:hypothetical protein
MKIAINGGRPGRSTETITVTLNLPDDDPNGHLRALLATGQLEALLRVCAQPTDLGAPDDRGEALALLERFAEVTRTCADRLQAMQLAARDRWGMTWGTIATAVDLSRSTTKGQIEAARARQANYPAPPRRVGQVQPSTVPDGWELPRPES